MKILNKIRQIIKFLGITEADYCREVLNKNRFYISNMYCKGIEPKPHKVQEWIGLTNQYLRHKTGINDLKKLGGDFGVCVKIITDLEKSIKGVK